MVTWQNRILSLCIPVVFMTACGQGALQQPDLATGLWQSADTKTQVQLSVLNWYSQDTVTLDPSKVGDLPVVSSQGPTLSASSKAYEIISLGFSEPLNGSPIATVTPGILSNILTPIQNSQSKIVEIWTYAVSDTALSSPQPFSSFNLSYRPDGGYIPPADTPISRFPQAAVVLQLTAALPPASIIAIHVISGKLSDADGIVMAQVNSRSGTPVASPVNGSPIAGTVWFQTK